MLVSILICLCFVSIWVVCIQFFILCNLITTCTHLLGCLLLNRYSSLFNRVITLSTLILRMLTYMFQLPSIIIVCCNLLGRINLISGRFCHLDLLQPLGFSLPSLNPYCSFVIARVFVLLFIWMISSSWFGLLLTCWKESIIILYSL